MFSFCYSVVNARNRIHKWIETIEIQATRTKLKKKKQDPQCKLLSKLEFDYCGLGFLFVFDPFLGIRCSFYGDILDPLLLSDPKGQSILDKILFYKNCKQL